MQILAILSACTVLYVIGNAAPITTSEPDCTTTPCKLLTISIMQLGDVECSLFNNCVQEFTKENQQCHEIIDLASETCSSGMQMLPEQADSTADPETTEELLTEDEGQISQATNSSISNLNNSSTTMSSTSFSTSESTSISTSSSTEIEATTSDTFNNTTAAENINETTHEIEEFQNSTVASTINQTSTTATSTNEDETENSSTADDADATTPGEQSTDIESTPFDDTVSSSSTKNVNAQPTDSSTISQSTSGSSTSQPSTSDSDTSEETWLNYETYVPDGSTMFVFLALVVVAIFAFVGFTYRQQIFGAFSSSSRPTYTRVTNNHLD